MISKGSGLFYYPADFTFVCPTELRELSKYHNTILQLGGEVLAISTDTVFSHRAWLESERLLKDVKYPMAAETIQVQYPVTMEYIMKLLVVLNEEHSS